MQSDLKSWILHIQLRLRNTFVFASTIPYKFKLFKGLFLIGLTSSACENYKIYQFFFGKPWDIVIIPNDYITADNQITVTIKDPIDVEFQVTPPKDHIATTVDCSLHFDDHGNTDTCYKDINNGRFSLRLQGANKPGTKSVKAQFKLGPKTGIKTLYLHVNTIPAAFSATGKIIPVPDEGSCDGLINFTIQAKNPKLQDIIQKKEFYLYKWMQSFEGDIRLYYKDKKFDSLCISAQDLQNPQSFKIRIPQIQYNPQLAYTVSWMLQDTQYLNNTYKVSVDLTPLVKNQKIDFQQASSSQASSIITTQVNKPTDDQIQQTSDNTNPSTSTTEQHIIKEKDLPPSVASITPPPTV